MSSHAAKALDHKALKRYRDNPLAFIEECFVDPETGRPFVLLDAEREFLKHAFRVGPDGRLKYPELVYAAPKKSGKTTLAAIVVIVLVVLYGGRYAEAICTANDFEQSVGRVFQVIRRIVESSPVLLAADAKITADRIIVAGAAIIAIPSNYASAAGSNQVIAVFDELWAFSSESARRLFDELVPPPTRQIACRLTVTYAGFEGESALLEELYKRGMQQPEVAPGLRAGDGLLMAWHHEPVAPWQTQAWLAEMRRSLRPNQYLRMIENRFVTSENPFIDLPAWDACVEEMGPVVVDRMLPVWVGVDAGMKHDSSAVVAVTWDQQAQKVCLVAHRVFQPSVDEPLDFESAIEETLRDFAGRFRVLRVLFDPWQMQAAAQRLQREGIGIEEFPQTPAKLTAASQNLFELISGRNLALYPDAAMRLAISRAVAVETPRGWRIAKEKQRHKVDVVIALAMAALAAVEDQTVAPALWSSEAFLVAGRPALAPAFAEIVFAVLVAGEREIGACFFVFTRDRTLYLIDTVAEPHSHRSIDGVIGRLLVLCQATRSRCGAHVFTSSALAAEFARRGQGAHVIDAILSENSDALALAAATHVSDGRVKVCSEALKVRHPLNSHGDIKDPLRLSALIGVAICLDEHRMLEASA